MDRQCIFEGCEKKKFCRGYCTGHYQQYHRGQTLRPLDKKWERAVRNEEGKTCSKCDKHKPWEAFYIRAKSTDGKQSACRECQNEQRNAARAKLREKKAAEQMANAT